MSAVSTPAEGPPKSRKREDDGPLPDPRERPLAPPPAEHVVPPRLAAMKQLGGVGTLGLEVALSIMFGLFGGQWLDGRFGTSPWITVAGFGFGVAAAIRAIIRQTRIMKKEAAKEEALEGNPAPLWESAGERDRRVNDERRDEGVGGAPRSDEDAPS